MIDTSNPPRKGTCRNCARQSVRMLDAPRIRIPASSARRWDTGNRPSPERVIDWQIGDIAWWNEEPNPRDNFRNPFEVEEFDGEFLICLAPEREAGELYCYICFDGSVWPSIRPHVINIPQEMIFDPEFPWSVPKWESAGREPARGK